MCKRFHCEKKKSMTKYETNVYIGDKIMLVELTQISSEKKNKLKLNWNIK